MVRQPLVRLTRSHHIQDPKTRLPDVRYQPSAPLLQAGRQVQFDSPKPYIVPVENAAWVESIRWIFKFLENFVVRSDTSGGYVGKSGFDLLTHNYPRHDVVPITIFRELFHDMLHCHYDGQLGHRRSYNVV